MTPSNPSQGTADLAVECRDVHKSFTAGDSRIHVLRGCDFDARRGEMTYLLGPSGCDKTTLISVLGAILTRDEGDIHVMGQDITKLKGRALARFRLGHLGFVFQQFNLLPSLSACENASLPLVAQGVSTRRAEGKAAELLEQLGLGDKARKMPNQLSGGEQQRVAIARALVHDPKVVICDEPTASLDASAGHRVMELLQDVAMGDGRAVVVVTHDNRILEFAQTIHHMSDGVITKTENHRRQETEAKP